MEDVGCGDLLIVKIKERGYVYMSTSSRVLRLWACGTQEPPQG